MAAILQLRRGTSTPTLVQSELFFNTTSNTLVVGDGSSNHTLVKIGSNTGNINLTGNLVVGGISGSSLNITGDTKIDGNLTLGGSLIKLGDEGTDEIQFVGTLSGSLLPDTGSTYDIGSQTNPYRNVYADNLSISLVNGTEIDSFISATNTFTSSQQGKDLTLASYTGSINNKFNEIALVTTSFDSRITQLETDTGSQDGRLDNLELFSSSQESKDLTLATYTSSIDDKFSTLETYTSSVDIKFGIIESFTSSQEGKDSTLAIYTASIDDKFSTLETYTSSVDGRLNNIENTTQSFEGRLDSIELFTSSQESKNSTLGTYTSSIDDKFSTLGTYTSSIDDKFSTLETYTASIDGKFDEVSASTASLNEFTSSQESKNSTLGTYTSSIDDKFDTLGIYTASVSDAIGHIHSYTASLKDALDVTDGNTTIKGNLTVVGTTTAVQSSTLNVADKNITIASGSTSSATSDGAGITIEGANATMVWNDANSSMVFNQKVSSSVGFKGDGSELTDVYAVGVDFNNIDNKPTLVSGSDQVTGSLDYRYLQIDGDDVVSGSSQIDLTQTTNYVSGIKDRLDAEGVISGSTQITNGSGLLSSSYTTFADYTASVNGHINSIEFFTGSQEIKNSTLATYTSSIDGKFTTLGTYTGSVNSKFSTLETYTQSVDSDLSILHSYTQSNDLDITELFATASQYESFSSSIDSTIKNKMNTEGVVSSSLDSTTIDFTITNGVITGDVIGGIVSGSSQLTQSLNGIYEQSGSVAQLVGENGGLGSLGTAAWYNVSSSISDGNPEVLGNAGAVKDYIDEQLLIIGAGDITAVIAGDGMSGGANSGPATLTLNTGSTHFIDGVEKLIGNGDGLVSSSLQVVGILNSLNSFTQSYFTSDSASFDSRLDYLEAYSSSLLVPSSSMSFRTLQTDLHVKNTSGAQINKGTVVRISGNTGDNPLISTASCDSENLSANTLGITNEDIPNDAWGYVITEGILTGINTTGMPSTSLLFLGLNGTFTTTPPTAPNHNVRLGQVLREQSNNGSIQVRIDNGYELGELHNIIDSSTNSSYGDILMKNGNVWVNNTSFSSSVDSRLGTLEGTPIENPLTFTDTTTINFTRTTDTITADVIGGIVSGSQQVINLLPSGVISGSIQILGGSGVWSGSAQLPSGVVSGSSQVVGILNSLNSYTQSNDTTNTTQNNRLSSIEAITASLNSTYEEKASGTHTLVSGSSQLTSSYDNRYVTLVGDQTIGGTKTFNNIVVNGTGSFSHIESVTSQAVIVGNSYVVVNNSTPTQRYAGISVYDSGSATPTTASFFFDGETNSWNYEYTSSEGLDFATALFGPEYSTKGSPTYPTNNKIQKGTGTHHLADTNITDTGTLITLGSDTTISGTILATGTPLVSGSSQINLTQTTNYVSGIKDRLNAEGVVSGSIQITKTLQNVTDAGATTTNAITISNSTASTTSTTGALIVTGGIGVGGSVNVAGDVVAYSSSDRRLKDNIQPIQNPLEKINKIGGYSFDWNADKQNIYKGKDYGVIAQEIEQILPELVENRENGYKAVKYDRLISLLIEGIKDLSNQVNELNEKINNKE
jgi:hypothetical protein